MCAGDMRASCWSAPALGSTSSSCWAALAWPSAAAARSRRGVDGMAGSNVQYLQSSSAASSAALERFYMASGWFRAASEVPGLTMAAPVHTLLQLCGQVGKRAVQLRSKGRNVHEWHIGQAGCSQGMLQLQIHACCRSGGWEHEHSRRCIVLQCGAAHGEQILRSCIIPACHNPSYT